MYNYRTTYTTVETVDTAALGAVLAVYSVIMIAIGVIAIVSMWKLFTKAGKPGWASIVPFYNMYTLFEIAEMNGWLFLLTFVPIANIVILIMMYINLAKAFGKTGGFAVGLFLLNVIFLPILAFGNAKYVGAKTDTDKADKTTE